MAWMDDADRLEAKGLARAKIRSKRLRVQMIRRRTLRGSLALFAVLWAVVFAQLVSGNDPALSSVPKPAPRHVAATEPGREPTPEPEVEAEAEPALEAEPVEEEFAEEEPVEEVVPEEEFVPEEEVVPEPEPEPEPVITSAS
jgi:outer membrane biosynthesis protein TonB